MSEGGSPAAGHGPGAARGAARGAMTARASIAARVAATFAAAMLVGHAHADRAIQAPAPIGSAVAPDAVARALGAPRLLGHGPLRRFGLHVYDARLWADGRRFDPARLAEHAFALELTYGRRLSGETIARASIDEIARLGFADDSRRATWRDALRRIFPDVGAGDRLAGVHRPGQGVAFFLNDAPAGSVDDPGFAAAFFAIWLDPRTAAPELRDALLAGRRGDDAPDRRGAPATRDR